MFSKNFVSFLLVGLISMAPVIELKGTLPFGVAQGLPLWEVFIVAYVFSCLPVPFIIAFLKPLMEKIRHVPFLRNFMEKRVARSMEKAKNIQKYSLWGLFVFVAIPLPGTGVWTGSIISATLDLDFKKSVLVIWLGNLVAGFAILALSYGLFGT